MSTWVVVLTVGAASLAIRALPLLAFAALELGGRARQGLRHAGIGAMAALLVTALIPHSTGSTHLDVAIMGSVGIGAVLAWRRWSMTMVVAAGLASYGALTALAMVL